MRLILASGSSARRTMLSDAGVAFDVERPNVDEDAAKAALAATGTYPRDTADALAQLKALRVSQRAPAALVLGSDSIVELADGTLLDKPESREDACDHLRRMSGTRVRLHSAAVMALGSQPVWRHVDTATLHVRALSADFITRYLDAEWPAIAACVGCFRIEGPGVQLFAAVEGSHFTILGLPLLPVLDYLRTRGVLTS
ncbi:septum formation protein [Sphingomonas guangdongensis]|uniref:Nucleoside triphosphate pyrophosphatase n=1 Tax=Sphingomonas guangdongensis TaxID=1141890 RepID=A0A285QF57_9SPHN|nr:nucleoside triphosphate pyrophosphatase [Sphingomonas guangdongensis]SOB80451.1 septum formation protein [Sphingomonas guangdongensis]